MSASNFCTLFLMNPCPQKYYLPSLPKLPLRLNKIESSKRYAHVFPDCIKAPSES